MPNSKKAVIVSLIFVLIIAVLFAIIMIPYVYFNGDRLFRNSIAGQLDYIIIGASHGLCSFTPAIIDRELSTDSYNLCSTLATFIGRKTLLEEELNRSNLKTVVIELSYNTFQRDSQDAEAELNVVPRINGMDKQISYFWNNIDIYGLDKVFGIYINGGLHRLARLFYLTYKNYSAPNLLQILEQDAMSGVDEQKGCAAKKENNIFLNKEECNTILNSSTIRLEFNAENVQLLNEIVSECRERSIDVVFAVSPVSDSVIWEYNNFDDVFIEIKNICAQYGCELYDFNLSRNRYVLYSDKFSFGDDNHMSISGANAFTTEFCRIMKMVCENEDVSNEFYPSYESMKADSPYWQFINQ